MVSPDGSIDKAIAAGVEFLRRAQFEHGEFRALICDDARMPPDRCALDSSPFVTALVLYSLGHVADPSVADITRRGLTFLVSEMEGPGLWRYYSRRQHKRPRVPPDLDDTCCISHLLERHGVPFPRNRWLVRANRNEAGRFYTWIVPRRKRPFSLRHWLVSSAAALRHERGVPPVPAELKADPRYRSRQDVVALDDVDPVVNANVLLFLGEEPATSRVVEYLLELIRAGNEEGASTYYADSMSLYYMVSRAYLNGVSSLGVLAASVTERIARRQQPDGSCGQPLLTALAACALLSFGSRGETLRRAIDSLLGGQDGAGSWPRAPMYWAPGQFWGSQELTTAFSLEALARYRLLGPRATAEPLAEASAAGHAPGREAARNEGRSL